MQEWVNGKLVMLGKGRESDWIIQLISMCESVSEGVCTQVHESASERTSEWVSEWAC